MSESNRKARELLASYLDRSVPEYDPSQQIHPKVDAEGAYPRYNKFADNMKPRVEAAYKESFDDIIRDPNTKVNLRSLTSEVHPLQKMLAQAGMSPKNLDALVTKAKDPRKPTTRDYEAAMYDLYLQAKEPAQRQNKKLLREEEARFNDLGMSNGKEVSDLMDFLKSAKSDTQYHNSRIAEDIAGAKLNRPVKVDSIGSLGRFYPDTGDIVVRPETISGTSPVTLHELLHKKDYDKNPQRRPASENLSSENFREMYGGRRADGFFSKTNDTHLDEPIELDNPEVRQAEAAKIGVSAAMYNKINKLLKDNE